MTLKKTLGLILSGVLSLSGIGFSESKIEKIEQVADLTGDGIKDVLLDTRVFSYDNLSGRYLFIGQKNGTFIRTKENQSSDGNIKYFITDDGNTAYFFDGQYYKKSPKQK